MSQVGKERVWSVIVAATVIRSCQHSYLITLQAMFSERRQPTKSKSSGKSGSTDSHTERPVKQFLTKSAVAACVTYILISKGDSLSTLSIHSLYGE